MWGNERKQARAERRAARRQRLVARLKALILVRHMRRGDAVRVIADEECRAVVTIYSYLEGWR